MECVFLEILKELKMKYWSVQGALLNCIVKYEAPFFRLSAVELYNTFGSENICMHPGMTI